MEAEGAAQIFHCQVHKCVSLTNRLCARRHDLCVCVCGSVRCVCVKSALVLIFMSAKTVQFILFKLHLKRVNITLANNHQSIIS